METGDGGAVESVVVVGVELVVDGGALVGADVVAVAAVVGVAAVVASAEEEVVETVDDGSTVSAEAETATEAGTEAVATTDDCSVVVGPVVEAPPSMASSSPPQPAINNESASSDSRAVRDRDLNTLSAPFPAPLRSNRRSETVAQLSPIIGACQVIEGRDPSTARDANAAGAPGPTMVTMDWFANNWPIILVALAVFIIGAGLLRRVAKMAFFGVAVGVLGLFLWPLVSESL